jgi:hypothetical protein
MKKTILLTLLVLLGISKSLAQDYEYVPFVREGVKWVYSIWEDYEFEIPADPTRGDNMYYRTLELRGDTVINGKTYKAMHKCVYDEMSEPSDVIPIYLREEDKKVYGIVPDGTFYDDAPIGDFHFGTQEYFDAMHSGQEFLLYDFQDPVAYWNSINKPFKVDTIVVGDHLAKRYMGIDGFGPKLIEGIGWHYPKCYPLGFMLSDETPPYGDYFDLEKVIENDEIIYPQNYSEDRYMPLIREGVKWVYERVTVNHGDTTCSYYTYEFKGNHPEKDNQGYTYKALYRYEGLNHELDVENDSLVAGLRENNANIYFFRNEPWNQVVSQGRNMINLNQEKMLYYQMKLGFCESYYLYYHNDIIIGGKIDPIMTDGYLCNREVFSKNGKQLGYVVEGIGFDSYDMGDLLTPLTRKPDPNAEYQEWCGLSHVIKNGEIIYKGMRYNESNFTLAGDVDTDGRVTMDDLTALINYLLNVTTSINMTNADIDANGKVGMDDLTDLINCLLTQTRK